MPDFKTKLKEKSHRSPREPLSGRRRSTQGYISIHKCPGTGRGQPSHTHSPEGGKGPERDCRENHTQNKLHETDLASGRDKDEQGEQTSPNFYELSKGPSGYSVIAENNAFHKTEACLQIKTGCGPYSRQRKTLRHCTPTKRAKITKIDNIKSC